MKFTTDVVKINHKTESVSVDGIAEKDDIVDVEITETNTGKVLYVNVNGITILRFGHIKNEIEVNRRD